MINIELLNDKTILEEKVFVELLEVKDEIERARKILALMKKAKELHVKTEFDMLLKAYQGVDKKTQETELAVEKCKGLLEQYTNLSYCKYNRMMCLGWVVNDTGIYKPVGKNESTVLVCYQPIVPIAKKKNLETGEEQVVLAYKYKGVWYETSVGRDVIASASKIIGLATIGISVNSENAKMLVKYLCDLENQNADIIPVQYSTTKLGWKENDFIPYDGNVIFDGDSRFGNLFHSITECGNAAIWMAHIKKLRAKKRMEICFLMAASFASALIAPLGALPFIVDLWGETEGGKTMSLMVAASIWANPGENQYIADFKSTDTALEVRSGMLNHLPMFLDDSSKTSSRIKENFEGFVYDLCSGKGKSRSNKALGVNKENTWCNVTICNGEKPLQSYVRQGGAINRILEVECQSNVYDDPAKTVGVIKSNYGFAGKWFVGIVKSLGMGAIRKIYEDIYNQLIDDTKMKKQCMSLAIVLTADRIATDHIFKDGLYISMDDARTVLAKKAVVSDNARCYEFLMDKVGMNMHRFDAGASYEQWGVIDDEYVVFFVTAFDALCREGGFSKSAFLKWADRQGLLKTQAGRDTCVKKIAGKSHRCIFLAMNKELEDNSSNEALQFN